MRWKKEEVEYLKENYSTCPSMKKMCEELGRSKRAIQHQGSRIGLNRPRFKSQAPSKRLPRRIIDKQYYEKNKEKIYQTKQSRTKEKIKKLKEMLGGKCSKCGYNKCFYALDFHHNSGKKEGNISRIIKDSSLQKSLKEVRKCILLCANCHRELHHRDSR